MSRSKFSKSRLALAERQMLETEKYAQAPFQYAR